MFNNKQSCIICCNKLVNMQSSIIIYSLNTIMLRVLANFFYTGEFGIVYRALYSHNSDFTSIPQPVAVKTLKGLLFTITLLILYLVHVC